MDDPVHDHWMDTDLLPNWTQIHNNVLAHARRTAVRLSEEADSQRIFGDEAVAAVPMGKLDFMREVGFDERYILLLNGWIEEQQDIVNQMGGVFQSELESSLQAIEQAKHTHTDESEED
jgi:hypothetical protein